MIETTLNRIREHSPCHRGWVKLLTGLGKTKVDDEPLSFSKILEINGLDDVLWCCRVEPQYAKEWRLFAVSCARRVQHLNPDPRVKNAIDVAERYAKGEATYEELRVARAAARAAAWASVGDAARAAAWAAEYTAGDAKDATWAAWGVTWGAACAARAAEYAALAAGAATDAELNWQTQEFLRVVIETEEKVA